MTKKEIAFIINILREGSIKWHGRNECFQLFSRKVIEGTLKNGKTKYKTYWHCAKCKQESRDKSAFEVDHIIEVGGFNGNWNKFIDGLFCDVSNLQLLCVICHKKKTSGYNSSIRFQRKNSSEYDDLL